MKPDEDPRSPVKTFDLAAIQKCQERIEDALAGFRHHDRPPLPFPGPVSAAVQCAVQAEQERRPEIEAALRFWIAYTSWPDLDPIGEYFLGIRLNSAANVLKLLRCAPVVSENGEYDLLRWILFLGWQKWGRDQWQAELETWAAWYQAGWDDGYAKTLSD